MAAYRTAARLFHGSHTPYLCIGMEYLRTNNLVLAEQFFRQAAKVCPDDATVYNEIGVVCFRAQESVHTLSLSHIREGADFSIQH